MRPLFSKKYYPLLLGLVLMGAIVILFVLSRANPKHYASKITPSVTQAAQCGNRTLAVILFNNSPNNPFDANQIANVFFNNANSVVNYFNENSLGCMTMHLSGQGVYLGPTRSSYTCSGSDYKTWTRAARTGISADYYVYVFPTPVPNDCPGGGWSFPNTNEAWLTDPSVPKYPDYAIHEMMHALGVSHSGTCSAYCSSVLGGNDPYDVMGHAALFHTSAFHKETLGWIPAATIASSAGFYTIDSINLPSAGHPSAIKVPIGTTGKYFYVEYHGLYGAFDNAANEISSAVLIRIAPFTPVSPTFYDSAIVGGAWKAGQTFVNTDPPIAIAVCSAGPSSATVEVRFNTSAAACTGAPPPITCVRNAPSVSVSTPNGNTGNPGDKVVYKATIVNNDVNCAASIFDFGPTLPAGWRAKPQPTIRSEQLLSGGSNVNRKFKISSSASASPGPYDIVFTVTNSDHPAIPPVTVQYVVGGIGATAAPLDADYNPFARLSVCDSETDKTVAAGTPCNVIWSLDYASSPAGCRLDPGGITQTPNNISVIIDASVTYRLTCTAGTSTSVTAVSVTVSGTPPPPPPPPPTGSPITISANPATVNSGDSTNVQWSSTGMASCSVGPNGWTGTSGNRPTGPLYATQTWTANCADSAGHAALPVSVVINVSGSPPPSCGGGYVRVQSGATYVGAGDSSTPGGIWQANIGSSVQLSPGTGYTSGQYNGANSPTTISGNILTSTGPADVFISGSNWILYNGASGCSLGAVEIKFAIPDFLLTCTPASQTVNIGSVTSYSVTVSPINGFNSPVTLSLQTVKPSTTTITSTGGSTSPPYSAIVVSVFTTAATPVATYTLTIRGVSGSLSHTCTTSPQLIVKSPTK